MAWSESSPGQNHVFSIRQLPDKDAIPPHVGPEAKLNLRRGGKTPGRVVKSLRDKIRGGPEKRTAWKPKLVKREPVQSLHLQLSRDHLLEFHDIGREFTDTFC